MMKINSREVYSWLAVGVVLYFAFKCIYISIFINVGVLPDELAHLHLINAYLSSNSIVLSPDLFGPSVVGSISQDRFLYHLLVSGLLKIFGKTSADFLFIRIISVIISIANVWFFYRLAKLVFDNPFCVLASLFVFTNVLMFTAMSCAINYDCLVFFLSTYMIYQLISFNKEPSLSKILNIIIAFLVGAMTKPSIYPFLIIILIGLIPVVLKNKSLFFDSVILRDALIKLPLKLTFTIIAFASFFVLQIRNMNLYGDSINLTCADIYSEEECAVNNAGIIYYNELREQNKYSSRLTIMEYYDIWIDVILQRSFGVAGHYAMIVESRYYSKLKLLLIIALFGLPLIFTSNDRKYLLLFFGIYFATIFLVVNYRGYLVYGVPAASVHGRYLFPVLSCFSILLTDSLSVLSKQLKLKNFLLIPMVLIFGFLDFPSFLSDENLYQFFTKPKEEIALVSESILNKSRLESNIDFINGEMVGNMGVGKYMLRNRSLVVSGWIFDETKRQPLESVGYTFDGVTFWKGLYGIDRPDVAIAFDNDRLIKTGFEIKVPLDDENLGDTIRLSLVGFDQDGLRYGESRDIVVVPSEKVTNE